MTKDEAIKIISDYSVEGCGICYQGEEGKITKALGMAIEALSAQKQGKWIQGDAEKLTMKIRCSVCGKACYKDKYYFNYCPNCGADMRQREE